MADRTETEFFVTPRGIMRRTIIEERINAEAAIERTFGAVMLTLPRIAQGLNGQQVHARIEGRTIILAQKIPVLNLATLYAPMTAGESTFMVPVFAPSPSAVHMDAKWTVPPQMRLWFITACEFGSTAVSCYLATQVNDRRGIYALPLNNLYTEAKICMGQSHDCICGELRRDRGATEVGMHMALLEVFNRTTWNTDLAPGGRGAAQVFRFDLEGKQLPMADDWANHIRSISASYYNWLVDLAV